MGLCHDPVDGVGIETRSESFCLTSERPEVGIYANADDCVEITYEFLAAVIHALRQVDNAEIQRALGPFAAGSPSSETERVEGFAYRCIACGQRETTIEAAVLHELHEFLACTIGEDAFEHAPAMDMTAPGFVDSIMEIVRNQSNSEKEVAVAFLEASEHEGECVSSVRESEALAAVALVDSLDVGVHPLYLRSPTTEEDREGDDG